MAGWGWGGPARGSGTGSRPPFQPGNKAGAGHGGGRRSARGEAKLARRRDRDAKLADILETTAENASHPYDRLLAAEALLNIEEGAPPPAPPEFAPPKHRDLAAMSDRELMREAARLEKRLAEMAKG